MKMKSMWKTVVPKGALSGAFPLENENCFLRRIIFRCSVFTVSAILIFPGESIFADFCGN